MIEQNFTHKTYQLHDEAGTIALGTALAPILTPGLVIYLHGDLGAGKTTLTRALLHASGHTGHVKSPTYALSEIYTVHAQQQTVNIVHIDLYRITDEQEFVEAGLHEEFNHRNICIIEWPEKANSLLPTPDIAIHLSIKDNGRDVQLHAHSQLGKTALNHLHFAPNI